MEEHSFTVEKEDSGERVDIFLAGEMEDFSRSNIQKLINGGDIRVNGVNIKPNYKLREGDVIMACIPDAEEYEIVPEDIPLDILYEDGDIIVINKPKGMVVHPAPGHYTGTLVNGLMAHCGETLSGINGKIRPGIVHRIDKDTSGILMAAKTNRAHIGLSEQLARHEAQRSYYAIVYNNIKEETGTIDKPIGRSRQDRKKMAVLPDGRRAVTHYRVLERFGKYTFIQARLETGRTHQIRVHMAHIGHSLLGDDVYSRGGSPFNTDGQVLHAGVLGFSHPVTGEYHEFTAELPAYFNKILEILRRNTSP